MKTERINIFKLNFPEEKNKVKFIQMEVHTTISSWKNINPYWCIRVNQIKKECYAEL